MDPEWLASRKGFEPLTPGLGNLCSILLSYRDGCGHHILSLAIPAQDLLYAGFAASGLAWSLTGRMGLTVSNF